MFTWSIIDDSTVSCTGFAPGYEDTKYIHLPSQALGRNVIRIANAAFQYSGLIGVEIPSTVTDIYYGAFRDCVNLENVTMHEGLLRLWPISSAGTGVFQGCTSLEYLEFPKGMLSVGGYYLYGCSSIQHVKIPLGCSVGTQPSTDAGTNPFTLEYVYYEGGNTVARRGVIVGTGGGSPNQVIIPEGTTEIEALAFASFGIAAVSIPSTVTRVDSWAFNACTSLLNVNYLGNAPTTGTTIYLDTPAALTSSAPTGATGWPTGTPPLTWASRPFEYV
jgi:hypothetical protein